MLVNGITDFGDELVQVTQWVKPALMLILGVILLLLAQSVRQFGKRVISKRGSLTFRGILQSSLYSKKRL